MRDLVLRALAAAWRIAASRGTLPAGPEAVDLQVVVEVERPAKPEHGDLATNLALRLARPLRMSPPAIANALAEVLNAEAAAGSGPIAVATVAGPGFINLTLTDGVLERTVARALAAPETWGRAAAAGGGRRVNVEFVSANPTGPLRSQGSGSTTPRSPAWSLHSDRRNDRWRSTAPGSTARCATSLWSTSQARLATQRTSAASRSCEGRSLSSTRAQPLAFGPTGRSPGSVRSRRRGSARTSRKRREICCTRSTSGSRSLGHRWSQRASPRRPTRTDSRWRSRRLLWRARQDSNLRPLGPEPNALSTELQARDAATAEGPHDTRDGPEQGPSSGPYSRRKGTPTDTSASISRAYRWPE